MTSDGNHGILGHVNNSAGDATSPQSAPQVFDALENVRDSIADVSFPLEVAGAGEARTVREQVLEQVEDHILPRLRHPDAPLLVVVGGSTGAGKSTLVNSLARKPVAVTGVRRPTTRSPVLVCHPDDRSHFVGEHAAAVDLDSELAGGADHDAEPVAAEELPVGVALLDTPDVDSVVDNNRDLAVRLIAVADLWLYVTTATRYADAVPWELLSAAAGRGTTLAVTLNRMPRSGGGDVREHLAELLAEHGFTESKLFAVPETSVEDSQLPAEAVKNVRGWLADLAGPERDVIVRGAVDGLLDGLRRRVPELAQQVEDQLLAATELRDEVDACYAAAVAELDEKTRDGSLLRGETLIRWQDYVGSGELFRSLRSQAGGFRAKLNWQPNDARPGGEELKEGLATALASEIRAGAHEAAKRTGSRWRGGTAGAALLEHADESRGESDTLADRAYEAAIRWQEYVQGLVRSEGTTKRSVARIVSVDLEGLALVLMVGLVGYTAAETPRAGAGGGAMVPRRLLAAIFGAESLRTIADKARADLRERMGAVLDAEAERFTRLLDAADVPDDAVVTRLYQATYSLEVAR